MGMFMDFNLAPIVWYYCVHFFFFYVMVKSYLSVCCSLELIDVQQVQPSHS
jgi:hypothetical protein